MAPSTIIFEQGSLDNNGFVLAGASNVAYGTIAFEQASVTNEGAGLIVATNGGIVEFDETTFVNSGLVQAGNSLVAGGAVLFRQADATLAAAFTNKASGIIEAANGGEIAIDALGNSISNAGQILAQDGGTLLLENVVVNNTNLIGVQGATAVTQLQIGA